MTFEEWAATIPRSMTMDPVWRRQDYRLATYVADVAWPDVEGLAAHPATVSLADQLYRCIATIGAHIAEGYSRGSGADRIRYYEYALGSARESREWYFKGRHVLPAARVTSQMETLTSVIRLLLTAIPVERQQRRFTARLKPPVRKRRKE